MLRHVELIPIVLSSVTIVVSYPSNSNDGGLEGAKDDDGCAVIVGATVGVAVGTLDGRAEIVGSADMVGLIDGTSLGLEDGLLVGVEDGIADIVGVDVGYWVGVSDGNNDGRFDGLELGSADTVGDNVGWWDGDDDGTNDGFADGKVDGNDVGAADGMVEVVGDELGSMDCVGIWLIDGRALGNDDGISLGWCDTVGDAVGVHVCFLSRPHFSFLSWTLRSFWLERLVVDVATSIEMTLRPVYGGT